MDIVTFRRLGRDGRRDFAEQLCARFHETYIYTYYSLFLMPFFLNVKMQNVEIQKYTLFLGKNWYFANHRAPLVGQRGARFHETLLYKGIIHVFLISTNPFSETRNNKQLKPFRNSGHFHGLP